MNAKEVLGQMSTSTFFKGSDIEGKRLRVKVSQVELTEQERNDKKVPQFVLHFVGTDKRLGLNVGNTEIMINNHGEESDDWVGKEIVLYAEPTKTPSGERTLGVRIQSESKEEEVSLTPEEVSETMNAESSDEKVRVEDLPF